MAGAVISVVIAGVVATVAAQHTESREERRPRFFADDPIWHDDDSRDVPPVKEFELSRSYEFVHETFRRTTRRIGPALNVNTLGEVPDSSWFTNRPGRGGMTISQTK